MRGRNSCSGFLPTLILVGKQGLKDSHDSSAPESSVSLQIPGLKKVFGKAVQQSKAAVETKPAAAPEKVRGLAAARSSIGYGDD